MSRNREYDIHGLDVPRSLFPLGKVRFSLGISDKKEAAERRATLDKLREDQHWDVLKAIGDHRISVAEVHRRIDRNGRGAVAEIRRDLEATAGGPIPTFSEQAKNYCADYAQENSPEGAKDIESRLNRVAAQMNTSTDGKLLKTKIGDTAIDEVFGSALTRAIRTISLKPNTRENLRVAVSGLYSWSIQKEAERATAEKRAPRWAINPAKDVKAIKRAVRVRIASDEELEKIRGVAEPYQLAYVDTLTFAGLRSGELRHLRVGLDLHQNRDWLVVIQDHPNDDRCTCIQCKKDGWSPKTKESYRCFHLPSSPDILRKRIGTYLKQYPAKHGDYLFRNPRTGRVWNARSLQDDFKALCAQAEVTYGRDNGGLTLHTLRHTAATNLLRAGVHIKVIASILGDTVETVATTYLNLDAKDTTEGLEKALRRHVGG